MLSALCNASLQSGELPATHKSAIVFPRLKKPTLDADDANSYRLISNPSFVSKFVERVVAARFTEHAERNKLFPSNQSAYRRYHNTETAVISVMDDIIRAIDRGEVTALVLLDLSAAFDTVDHQTLLDVLHRRFAVDSTPLQWFKSYLTDRSQSFFVDGAQSAVITVDCSVPRAPFLVLSNLFPIPRMLPMYFVGTLSAITCSPTISSCIDLVRSQILVVSACI